MIKPPESEIKDTTDNTYSDPYLDIYFRFDNAWTHTTRLYGKHKYIFVNFEQISLE